MIDRKQAEKFAFEAFKSANGFDDIVRVYDLYVILEDKTIEKAYGWVFFFTTKKYLESGDYKDGLGIGMGPILVNKDGRSAVSLGTWGSIEQLISKYEEQQQQ